MPTQGSLKERDVIVPRACARTSAYRRFPRNKKKESRQKSQSRVKLANSPERRFIKDSCQPNAAISNKRKPISRLRGEAIKRGAYYNRTHVFVTITFLHSHLSHSGQEVSALWDLTVARTLALTRACVHPAQYFSRPRRKPPARVLRENRRNRSRFCDLVATVASRIARPGLS